MGDGHHRDAHVLVQVVDGLHHLLPAPGIKHGGGLVQDQAVGPHGDHARNGNALLLAAGQIFQRKSDIFLHHGGNNLVVRALEHHAHGLADIVDLVLVFGVHPLHQHSAALRQKDGVEVLGQRGFSTAVGPQHCHKFAPLHLSRHAVQGVVRLFRVIAELQIFRS